MIKSIKTLLKVFYDVKLAQEKKLIEKLFEEILCDATDMGAVTALIVWEGLETPSFSFRTCW